MLDQRQRKPAAIARERAPTSARSGDANSPVDVIAKPVENAHTAIEKARKAKANITYGQLRQKLYGKLCRMAAEEKRPGLMRVNGGKEFYKALYGGCKSRYGGDTLGVK